MRNTLFLTKEQLFHIKQTWQQFLLGKHPDDEEICLHVLKMMEPKERMFMRNVYVTNAMKFDDWMAKCAEKAGIPEAYGWIILRFAEGKFGLEKGWFDE